MKSVFTSRMVLLAVSLVSIFVVGCGKSDDATAETPKGTAQRSDVQAAPIGGGASGQQPVGNVQKPAFDTTK